MRVLSMVCYSEEALLMVKSRKMQNEFFMLLRRFYQFEV